MRVNDDEILKKITRNMRNLTLHSTENTDQFKDYCYKAINVEEGFVPSKNEDTAAVAKQLLQFVDAAIIFDDKRFIPILKLVDEFMVVYRVVN
jgi:hypothetical protein